MITQIEREQRLDELKSKITTLKKEIRDLENELYKMNRERNFMNFIANRIQVVKQDGEINSADVERIVISDYCLQSSPCQHDCEIYYKDGSMKKIRHDGRYIAQNYFYILNDQDKMHFYVYLK
jgi:hypothetical protein